MSVAAAIRAVALPEVRELVPAASAVLVEVVKQGDWVVCTQSNRVGVRPDRPEPGDDGRAPDRLQRRIAHEIPSEGIALGSLQVPPRGQLVLFLTPRSPAVIPSSRSSPTTKSTGPPNFGPGSGSASTSATDRPFRRHAAAAH